MFKKVLACFFSVLTFSLVFASNTNALTMSALEPQYAPNSKIELNTPTDGNTFDVTFLAKNQNLTYKATITNDQEDSIEITQIDFNDSYYDFLEYSYDGITVGDEIEPGESKIVTLNISSNNQRTRTVEEDFKFTIHYHKIEIEVPDTNEDAEPENNTEKELIPTDTETSETTIPDTGANSTKENASAKSNNQFIYILAVLAASIVLLIILIASKKVKTSYAIIAVLSFATTFLTLSHFAIAEKDQIYTISGKVRFTNVYSLSIDPGQGLYNGQAGITTIEHRDGEEVNIEQPTYESYRFTGWTKTTLDPITGEPAESEPFAGGPLTTDQSYVLTANWEEIYYSISINPNGGTYEGSTDIYTASVRYGEELPVSTPTYSTYSFTGWTKTYTDEETGETISEPFTGSTITASADYTLTANWEEIYYDFTINPNGGSYEGSTETTTIPFRAGATATLSNPEKEGTTFTGWTKITVNEETGETISEPLVGNSFIMEENTTLIANYEDLYFDITINANGGTYTGETSLHVKYGTEVTLPNPTYYTYGFTGWTINPTATLETTESSSKLVVKNNHTLTANWEELYFNLTINPNGGKYNGSTATYSDTLRAGTTVTLLTASKEGATFVDWTKNGISTTETSFVIEEDTTLIANYTDNYYDVVINPNGGTYTGETSVNAKHGTDITINNPTRDTYRFTGWAINPTTTLEDTEGGKILHVNQPYTLTANWEEIRYNLVINPNGGTYEESTEIQTAPYHVGTTVTIALPGKTGANFTNWTKAVEDPETGNTTTEAFTGTSLTISGNTTLTANYEDIYFDVTVNPNGGKFHNSTATYTDSIKYGEYLDLTSIARDGYDLREWALNETDTLPYNTESIQILSNTSLTARWWSNTTYTVTLNPNGGKYNDGTSNFTATVREGEDYTITGTPTRDDYRFEGWLKEDNTALTSNTFTVNGDITLHADWFLLAVRNERTGTYYETLTTAEAEAENGDTLTVLVDLTEKFVNSKNVTLDLNGHTITGFMINNGEITLLNGEFNNYNAESTAGLITDEANPNGAAVINNGKLTLGIDDYEDNEDHVKSALVNNNYVRLIGSGMGIKQNGELYYYDGYIEGDIALEGGYNDSPWYRDTFDGVVVRHFPFVDRNNTKNCQHIALENSDRAVTKTVDNGEIYYYNLQDNINTSVRTGYKIYAVRDFDASYAINSPANTDVTFDIIGKTITINDTITVDGKFTIEDSSTIVLTTANAEGVNGNLLMPEVTGTAITTPHETTTTVATYGGIIQVPQTIINNGEFAIKNARVTGTTANDTIQNFGTLTMENGILGATTGYVMQPKEGAVYNLDNNSYLYSSTSNKPAVYNTLAEFTWDTEGIIAGQYYGLENTSGKTTIIENGTIYSPNISVVNSGTITIKGGLIKSRRIAINGGNVVIDVAAGETPIVVNNQSNSETAGIYSANSVTINNGNISVTSAPTSSSSIYGIGSTSYITMNNGNISVTGGGTLRGVTVSSSFVMENGTISVIKDPSATGTSEIHGITNTSNGTVTINNGSITVDNVNGAALGAYANCSWSTGYGGGYHGSGKIILNDGSVTVHTANGYAYGFYGSQYRNNTNSSQGGEMTTNGGTITATSDNNTAYGIIAPNNHIYGGKIEGGTYGIYVTDGGAATLGVNDGEVSTTNPEIIGGSYGFYGNANAQFYDGVIRGGIDAYQEGLIRAIPDATTYHIESSDDYAENCWLVDAANYLSVNNVGYNSLAKAYDAITEESGTITVIDNATVEAVLPGSPENKNITLDLNGYQLTYTQSLINNSNLTIVDNSEDKTGKIQNTNNAAATIINNTNATLTVNSGYLTSAYRTIENRQSSTLNINGGTITGNGPIIVSEGAYSAYANVNISDGNIVLRNSGSTVLSSNNYTNITITGGQILAERTEGSGSLYAINGGNVVIDVAAGETPIVVNNQSNSETAGIYSANSVTINNGNISVTSAPTSSSSIYGIGSTSYITMNNGNISVTGGGTLRGVTVSSSFVMENGTISVIKDPSATGTSEIHGITNTSNGTVTINNGSITVDNVNGAALGAYANCSWSTGYGGGYHGSGKIILNDGSVTVHTANGYAYGFYGSQYRNNTNSSQGGEMTTNGGTITATSDNNTAYGIIAPNNHIYGGKIEGGTYGIYVTDGGAATLGVNDGEVSTTNPEIIGGSYGFYGNANAQFYDGVIRGGIDAYQEGLIKAIADNTAIHQETQTIGEKEYDTRFLEPEHYVAQIGETKYKKLSEAIDEANENDVIELLEDNHLFYQLIIPAEKNITIELNGYTIVVGHPIINNGKTIITNNINNQNPTFTYSFSTSSNYYITNNSELTLQNLNIVSPYAINNKGTLTLETINIESTNIAINNTGNVNANNLTINCADTALYNNGGTSSYTDIEILGRIDNVNGDVVFEDGAISITGTKIVWLIDNPNSGSITLNDITVTLETDFWYSGSSRTTYVIRNAGTLEANNSTIQEILKLDTDAYVYGINNTSGTATFNNTNIIVDASQTTTDRYYGHGIHNDSGTVTITSGRVDINRKTSYGIWNETGTIIIGVPEPTTSPNYGKENADVSTTNPSIRAIGTDTGIGIKNNSTGKIYYYDGIITGTTATMPEIPAGIEYLYEPKDEVDENGYHVRTLEWMREQPGL